MLLAKRAIKRSAGLASVALRFATAPARWPSACVLVYHRVAEAPVTERRLDDWNVRPDLFEQQVAALAKSTELIFARDLVSRLRGPRPQKPLACLTFDDGFQNFHDYVLPVLKRHQAKATAFVVSGFIDSRDPMPFDRWGQRHAADAPAVAWRAMSWQAIEACAASGCVEIGGHSHTHPNAATTAAAALVDEVGTCQEILRARLGPAHAVSYAYPYGSSRLGQVPDAYVAAVKAAGFTSAMTTDLGLVTGASDAFRLPRVEAYRSDGPAVLRAKVRGTLAPFLVTDRLRQAKR